MLKDWKTLDLLSVLPHRAPFLLVDRVTAGEEGCWIRAARTLTADDPFLSPAKTLPAPLLIEAIAQAAAALLLSSRPGVLPVLLGVDRTTFAGTTPARLGDTIHLYAEIVWLRRRVGHARGAATDRTGTPLCQAEFTFGWKLPGEPLTEK